MKKLKDYYQLLRVKHYLKNLLIFLPLFFGNKLYNSYLFKNTFFSFIIFCLLTSIIYIINDINDVEKDRKHPTKCKRPIASGNVSINEARLVIFVISSGIILLIILMRRFGYYPLIAIMWLLVYLLINLLYSNKLKTVPILDVAILAMGFLVRLYYGSCVSKIDISSWLYLTVLGGAFYLGLGKRRNELTIQTGANTRDVLKRYSYTFLDKNMYVCVAFTEMTYALWAVQNNHNGIKYTVPIVMVIFMKYSLDIEDKKSEGNPMDILLSDKYLLILIVIFLLVSYGSIYAF